jgi:transglutaminase-like putative cysteine protease
LEYDIRLKLSYDYDAPVGGGRHQVRVSPRTLPGVQRVVAASVDFAPRPAERSDFTDFFGNPVTAIAYRDPHDELDVRMSARVSVRRPEPGIDLSPPRDGLKAEILAVRSLSADAPHHFLAASRHAPLDEAITEFARACLSARTSTFGLAEALCRAIHEEFVYDGDATTVSTRAVEAFALRRGVCQDFSHVMIAGLRGLDVPAGYVSGFLRTTPPPGKPRLEGADAMHAWVRVWCGRDAGWREFDPTNGILAGNDHITVGYGRDYADVAPIVGILKTTGGQAIRHAVDVVPVG